MNGVRMKKITFAIILLVSLFVQNVSAQKKNFNNVPVQVVNQDAVNLTGAEAAWLPGQIQDKLKSNLQEYLGMKTVVDSKAEAALKKLQAESESAARDEASAIELGKITSAKYALFTKVRKTASGYAVSVDFTDLTTGEQMASVTSKEYSKVEYLYGSTGAVDEITLLLSEKLGIEMSGIDRNRLSMGSADFSLDDQLKIAQQNEVQFKKQMEAYDAELTKLMASNDISSIQNRNKIEADKALLEEKQQAEAKRREDLKKQKEREEADKKLESERSIALKTQRDKMAKEAAEKAAQVRKLKTEKLGILEFINTIENKKKALIEIRQGVEERCDELYIQLRKDETEQAMKILTAEWKDVEKKDGNPTENAKQRRVNSVKRNNEALYAKFYADCQSVEQSTLTQQNALLQDIEADYKKLSAVKTVSSMGDELKVSYGTYDADKYGWNAYLSLYSDGILLFSDSFIVKYETLAGKPAPNLQTATDAQFEEYADNTDMYTSLLVRGVPVLYFEFDYNAVAAEKENPSQYTFYFTKVRTINTVSGKEMQTSTLNKELVRTIKPEQDFAGYPGIVESQKQKIAEAAAAEAEARAKAKALNAKAQIEKVMVKIPGQNYEMMATEVTQGLYKAVMGENPSWFRKDNNELYYYAKPKLPENTDSYPVEYVSWYDAIYFCNKLSQKCGLEPVYSVNGSTDVTKWGYTPHNGNKISGKITKNSDVNGYRLPTEEEWEYAARGGQNYKYAGSDNLKGVGWNSDNSGGMTHPVAQKAPNGYGLYDMSGNVWEWCWDIDKDSSSYRCGRGGSWYNSSGNCRVDYRDYDYADNRLNRYGFRLARTIK